MRRRLFSLLVPIMAVSAAWAVARVDAVRRVVLPRPPTAEAQLERPVGDLRIEGATFEQALEILRQRTGAKITVDREAIAKGLADNADAFVRPLELKLRDLTLGQVLGRLCAATDPERLTYIESGEGIVITTRDGLEPYTCVRVYDIRDVLPRPGGPLRRKRDWYTWSEQNRLPPNWNEPRDRDDDIADIADAITQLVTPAQWADNGGIAGSIREIDGRLIIRQTPTGHRQIARLLDGLRATGDRASNERDRPVDGRP